MQAGQVFTLWNRVLRNVIGLAQGVVYAACILGLIGGLGDWWRDGTPLTVAAVAILSFVVLMALAMAVHEIGHAVAATLAGWRVAMISIHRLTIWPSARRVRWGAPAFAAFGGAVLAVAPLGRPVRNGYVALMLGGALGNLAIAVLALALSLVVTHPMLQRLLEVVSLLSGAMAVFNLIPFFTQRGGSSDGRKALDAFLGRDLEPYGRETRLYEEVVNHKPPLQWDPALLRAVEDDIAAGRNSATGDMLLYSLSLARGDLPAAKTALARAVAKLGAVDSLMIEQAFMLAFADRDPAAASQILDRLPLNRVRRSSTYWRTRGTIEILTGKPAAASFARARALLGGMPFTTEEDYRGIALLEHLPLQPAAAGPIAA